MPEYSVALSRRNNYIRAFLCLKEKARQKKQKNVPFYRWCEKNYRVRIALRIIKV